MSRVVALSFYKVRYTNERLHPFLKSGQPLVQVEVLGDRHTFTDIGNLIFDHYLRERLNEELYEHVWRFEPYPEDEDYAQRMNKTKPLLANDMTVEKSDIDEPPTHEAYNIQEGSEFLFFYDEGSPTRLMVTIDRIYPLPEDKTVDSYPCRTDVEPEDVQTAKRQRIQQAPILTIKMDEAYPNLKYRLLQEHGISFSFGNGCLPKYGSEVFESNPFSVIWGGGKYPAYQRSLECFSPFTDIDEFFLCAERGIQKQVSTGYPQMMQKKQLQKLDTGEVYFTEQPSGGDSPPHFQVIAQLYPSSVPEASYRPTMEKDLFVQNSYRQDPGTKCLKSWSTYCFNFALPANWRTADPINFSFARQFPKCARWLTNSTSTCYWMKLEGGILTAIKGRSNPKKEDNIVHTTMKHESLHDLFADMESQIVLPKSWK